MFNHQFQAGVISQLQPAVWISGNAIPRTSGYFDDLFKSIFKRIKKYHSVCPSLITYQTRLNSSQWQTMIMEDYFLISICSFAAECANTRHGDTHSASAIGCWLCENSSRSGTAIALNFYPYSDVLIPPGGCGVAWYPTGFGSLRLRSKSGQPHVI